ncbi:aminotransferase class IV [Actinomadura luteofluorescens]|uniref:aminotransferase class IV n=1 Tax=Actinomadura luteofluorescens TaxID=46163 RepID=UPI0036274268
MTTLAVQRNGRAATSDELAPLAFAGFAHFTAMQVRGGKVRGLDLHLGRLRSASMELFGRALPDERVRSYLRAALEEGPADVSLTATMYSSPGEFTAGEKPGEPEVLVRTGTPASGPQGPLRLATVQYDRYLPALKHVGEVAKTHLMRRVVQDGFDDAAFVDRRGRLSEATIWNLAFWGGDAVVWPEAEMLPGTTMGIVRSATGPPRRPPTRPAGHPRRRAGPCWRRGHELLDAGGRGPPDRRDPRPRSPTLPGPAAPGLQGRTLHRFLGPGVLAGPDSLRPTT